MKRLLKELVFNFFLHIEINTLNLPYLENLPRPYKANKLSKILRKVFEKRWIRRVFGFNLATAMLVVPLLTPSTSETIIEHPLNISAHELVSTADLDPSVSTKTTEYVLPVERLRFVGQSFKAGHPGYDLNSYIGDDVLALTSGQVHTIENGQFGLGRYIILDHGFGLISVYGHLKSFNVVLGDVVRPGDKIGEIGMTGYTTGPHLHFEIHDNGVAVNPRTYLGF